MSDETIDTGASRALPSMTRHRYRKWGTRMDLDFQTLAIAVAIVLCAAVIFYAIWRR